MEKRIETTIGIMGYILGLYRDNGKENGNYYNGVMWPHGCCRRLNNREFRILPPSIMDNQLDN